MLEAPLTSEERADGWESRSKRSLAGYFERRRARLYDPRPLTEDERSMSVMKALDAWGLEEGALANRCAQVCNDIADVVD
jgi:hypothetical protein